MVEFKKFHEKWGEGERYAEPPEASLVSEFAVQLMIDEWSKYGLARYADGQIWTVDPSRFRDTVRAWLPDWSDGPDRAEVFGRTTFGDLFLVRPVNGGEAVGRLSVHYGRYSELGSSLRIFMNSSLTNSRYLSVGLAGGMAADAEKILGRLDDDEMFTFVPALPLGGSDTLEHVQKVKMMPQLDILGQLYDRIEYQK